jgi:hypothetical protein
MLYQLLNSDTTPLQRITLASCFLIAMSYSPTVQLSLVLSLMFLLRCSSLCF